MVVGEAEVRSRAARVVDDEHVIDGIRQEVADVEEGAGGAESLRRRCRRPSVVVTVVVDMVDPKRGELSIKSLSTARSLGAGI